MPFRESAGVGTCSLWPRQASLLLHQALASLCALLQTIENQCRLPSATRVTAIKSLEGTANWHHCVANKKYAKTIYIDVRCQIEAQLERAYFFAAPGKGAANAVARQSVATEAAVARRGHEAATSLFDLDKLYDSITTVEAYTSLIRFGMRKSVALLSVYVYLSARCIIMQGGRIG